MKIHKEMHRVVLGAVVMLGSFATVSAQTTSQEVSKPVRNLHLELFGGSNGIGIQYDSRLKGNSGWGYGLGAGWGFAYSSADMFGYEKNIHNVSLSPRVNYLLGRKNRKLELGFGVSLGYQFGSAEYDQYDWAVGEDGNHEIRYAGHVKESMNMMSYFFFGNIGYRRQAPHGFLFRVGVAPFFGFEDKHSIKGFGLSPYLGFGWSF